MKGWQPIETAPKDSWELHQMRAVGAWRHNTLGWIWGHLEWRNSRQGGYYIANGGTPTHWMPLPDPPEAL